MSETESLNTSFGDELRRVMAEQQAQSGGSAAERQSDAPDDDLDELVNAADLDEDEQASADAAADESAETETDESRDETITAPENWSAKDREAFEKLDDEGRKLVLGIEKTMKAGLTKATTEAAGLRKQYAHLERYIDNLHGRAEGLSREDVSQRILSAVPEVMGYYIDLQSKPVETMLELADQMGVTDALSEKLSESDYQDESTAQLRRENASLKRQLQQRQYQDTDRQTAAVSQTVADFASAKDESGNLKHPHFEEVRPYMAKLMEADQELDMDGAYEAAVRAKGLNAPDENAVRDKIMRELREKARKARKVQPNGDGRSGGNAAVDTTPPEAKESRRETLVRLMGQQIAN